ncbi:MAG: chorismate synthase [Synergistaceae bacterium]|jgi:chorismate synthase|nr:chorismate synthase [Synergistaceae bacterium]
MNVWGNAIKLSIFGESHGAAVGIVVDGLPAGEVIDEGAVTREMERRAPGRGPLATARRETDALEVLSGLYGGKTTGFPVCGVIRSADARPDVYNAALRPGHADWTALLKYGGHADMRGGGHFSGRLTAPLVFAGSLAKQILARKNIEALARIASIESIEDNEWRNDGMTNDREGFRALSSLDFPASPGVGMVMKKAIEAARDAGDSVGGVVEGAVFGLPGGLGEPFFGSMESAAASLLFSIPAVKGVEFGDGFRLAAMRGSEANDSLYVRNGVIGARTNHNGGILGGITNGLPLVVRAAFKPTPSIAHPQDSVDAVMMKNIILEIKGRHDPCVTPRAVPVVEACLALCVLDMLLTFKGTNSVGGIKQ